jgi:hypothetical protein
MADSYKLYGTKVRGEKVNRVILEGTSAHPVRWIDVRGDSVELTEEEVETLRARGLELRKQVSSSEEPEQQAETPEEAESQEAPKEAFVTPPSKSSGKTPKS